MNKLGVFLAMAQLSAYNLSYLSSPNTKIKGKLTSVRNSKIDPKIGRNDPCVCGSGKKYKKCCININ